MRRRKLGSGDSWILGASSRGWMWMGAGDRTVLREVGAQARRAAAVWEESEEAAPSMTLWSDLIHTRRGPPSPGSG